MADILYIYNNQVYANITNRCNCSCRFCIRTHGDGVGNATTLWHQEDPSLEKIIAAMDQFDFTGFQELVFCGYGEPTCALEHLIASARYAKEQFGLSIRLNTNGLGNLYHKKDIVPLLAEVVDTISISLNAPDSETYQFITRPQYPDAFPQLLDFAKECKETIPHVKLTVVDVIPPDQIERSKKLAEELGIELRIREYSA